MAADLLNERLPPDWSYGVTNDGRIFFISERHRETSWLHPVTGRPVQTGHQGAPGLSNGWEQDFTPEGVTYFIDHNNGQTTFGHPVTGRPVSEENPPPPPRSPPQSPNENSQLKRGAVNAKQRSLKAPSAKRNPSSQVVRRGFLYRLETGGISKTWKRRWCVLADFALFIYKNDDEKVTLGSILLPSYRINRCTPQDPVQKEFAFKVEHENTKTFYFHTDTQTDLDSWLSNLRTASTMKGNTGFLREANNIKPGMGQRSPPYADQRRDYPDSSNRSPQSPESNFNPQWRNPNPSPTSQPRHHTLPPERGPAPQSEFSGQPSWRSVPDLERDSQDPRGLHPGPEYNPQGSLQSLPPDGGRNQDLPLSNLRPDLREYPHHQSFDPRLGQKPRISDIDPRGSVRSLQVDPLRLSRDFVPLGQSGRRFQPYQRPGDPQQRSSLVSDPGRHRGHSQGSPQRSPQDVHSSQSNVQGSYRPNNSPRETVRNGDFPPNQNRYNASGGIPADRDRNSWQGHSAAPHGEPRGYSDPDRGYPQGPNRGYPDPNRGYPDPNRGYPDPNRGYPDPNRGYPEQGEVMHNQPEANPRLSTSRDPRGSYASSRHSLASQGHVGDGRDRGRDYHDSKQNLFPSPLPHHHGSRNSLPRSQPTSSPSMQHPPPQPHHNTYGHTYMNVPDVRHPGQQGDGDISSPPPQRPPYPAAVRDQIVHDLAESRSPGTAEKMLTAHEMNKQRMQESMFFQYPTPPRNSGSNSRLDDPHVSETVKRLSQYSDRNSLASNSAMRNDPANTSSRSQRGSSNDYTDNSRRQDSSGSGQFSDSFERRSREERRAEDPRREGGQNGGGAGPLVGSGDLPPDMRFGGDPEAKTLRQAYERVQSFRQSSASDGYNLKQDKSSNYTQPETGNGGFSDPVPLSVSADHKGMDIVTASESEAAQRSDINFFEYSLSSQISMGHSLNNPQFVASRQNPNRVPKSQFPAQDRVGYSGGGQAKDDLEVSQNSTLSPSGSYHHIDRDLDQLYSRGSAFRPPSSISGSVRNDGLFHSLPRSYKYKGIQTTKTENNAGEKYGPDDRWNMTTGSSANSSQGDWEWYKAKYLSPTQPSQNRNDEQTFEKQRRHQRSRSDLGFHQQVIRQKLYPNNDALMEDLRWKFVPVKPARGMFPSDNDSNHSFGKYNQENNYKEKYQQQSSAGYNESYSYGQDNTWEYRQQNMTTYTEPQLQSWPRQELTARQLDVPTPTSLSSHPFFVPEDQPVSPPPPPLPARDMIPSDDGDGLTPRSHMDKELRKDLDEGVYARLKAREGMNRRPIQTVREEPDMPDNEVLETKVQKKYPLNGTRIRMSISAGDLIGKTHDELVLLLIQLRRNQAALEKARDFYRELLNKRRPVEREYRKQRHDSMGRLEHNLEEGHQSFVDTRSQLEEVENKLEVYRPLINLVDNMVTMGSLYGGDNLMLATQYRKHLLRPDQYQPPRKMLEFSRQHQEERVIAGIENDVRQLSAAEVDLEEKIQRLNQLEHLLQEQSFKVASFREDKELLEKALQGILRHMREGQDSPRDIRRLQQQQASVHKELSRVTQDLAEASKALEETTVENNKVEHEVALLRTKVHGELKRSKSAPSLGTENANAKVKMERELARVQNMLQGLSQQGEKLSEQMSTIRRSSSGTQLAAAFDAAEKTRKVGTYLQTDLDSGQQVDLAQQIPVSPESPLSPSSPPSSDRPIISHQRQESTHGVNNSMSDADPRDWDIGDADDNTKRFYGLLPKEKPKGLTVRDVKRQSEQRRERKRDEEGQEYAFKVSSTDDDSSTFIHARYPSLTSSQSSGLDLNARDPADPMNPLYENLPRSGSMPTLNGNSSAPGSRRSSITLMAPKPFTPYQDRTVKPFRSELALNSNGEQGGNDMGMAGGNSGFKPFNSEIALNSGWSSDRPGYPGATHEPLEAGQVVVVSDRLLGRSEGDLTEVQSGMTRSTALPSYTRVPQPFRRDASGVSQSTPHLDMLETPSPSTIITSPLTGMSRPDGENVSRVYAPRPWAMDRAFIQPGLYDVKKSPKGRYMTISSSKPTTMESMSLQHSPHAGDLISNATVGDVPDVVKSSIGNVDKIDQMDEDMIEREILYFPEKVLIPERYDAEADAEHLSEAEKRKREEKAERIKRLLTNQSVLSMSQPDVNKLDPGQLHSEVLREKEERAHILSLNQELARQVTCASKRAAAERRKTWSGGQIADIKVQYEAEQMASPGQSDSRVSRQANILL